MGQTTTSAPQQGLAMPALDLRQLFGTTVLSEGVRNPGDLLVAQRAAGANMSVDVAPGAAAIIDDHVSGGGFYGYTLSTATNATVTGADPTNPRIDRVVVRVRDQALGDAANDHGIVVLAGTPTAGATLVNLNGAAAVPTASLLLANVLVPALSSSVTNANISTTLYAVRVRANVLGYQEFTSAVAVTATTEGGSTTVVSGQTATYDGNVAVAVEFACPQVTHSVAGTNVYLDLFDSGTALGIMSKFGPPTNGQTVYMMSRSFVPSAGSHTYKINAFTDSGTATFQAQAAGAGTLMPGYIRVRPA